MRHLEQRVELLEKKMQHYKIAHTVIALVVGGVVTASALTKDIASFSPGVESGTVSSKTEHQEEVDETVDIGTEGREETDDEISNG